MDFNRSYRLVVYLATGKQHISLNLVTEIRVQLTDDEEWQVSAEDEEEEIFFLSVMTAHTCYYTVLCTHTQTHTLPEACGALQEV